MHGQTRVYCNQSTTPLIHWPFRRQTAKQPEVSPEVNLMGWPRLKCLGPGSAAVLLELRSSSSCGISYWVGASRTLSVAQSFSPQLLRPHAHRTGSSLVSLLLSSHNISFFIASLRTAGHTTPSQRQTLSSQYRAPQLLCPCDIASLRYSTSTTCALTRAVSTGEVRPPGSYIPIK